MKVWLLVVWCCVWIAVSALAASDSLVQEGTLRGENIGLSFSSPAFAHMYYTALEREGKASNAAVSPSALAAVDSLYIANGEMAMDIIGLFDISHSECLEMKPLPLKDLNCFPNLEKLSIINTPLRELDVLAQLPHLRSVTLRGCSITDCSFAAALTELSHLELACNEVTDLSPLVSLQSLQVLDVSHCPVAGFEPLMHLENLTHFACKQREHAEPAGDACGSGADLSGDECGGSVAAEPYRSSAVAERSCGSHRFRTAAYHAESAVPHA